MNQPYLYPMSKEQETRVLKNASERLAEFFHAQVDMAVIDDKFPGLEHLEGRELYHALRAEGLEYWYTLWASYPRHAVQWMRRYARLAQKYGGENGSLA